MSLAEWIGLATLIVTIIGVIVAIIKNKSKSKDNKNIKDSTIIQGSKNSKIDLSRDKKEININIPSNNPEKKN